MNRISRESLSGGRNTPAGSSLLLRQQQCRRGRSLVAGGAAKEGGDEGLDLFSRNRRSLSIAGAPESDGQNVPPNLGGISVESAKLAKSGMDDLLSAAEMGKHDYDWLLTPPGTPLFSSSDASEPQLSLVAPRSNSSARSVSTTKASRFSVSQSENNQSSRPARSTSVMRPSISTTHSSSHFSSNSNRTSVLNTSTASVSSSRPSTPGNRSTTLPAARQLAPTSSRSTPARSSTPSKIRPAPSSAGDKIRPAPSSPGDKTRPAPSSLGDKTRPLHGSRPSTPTSRTQIPASLSSDSNSMVSRSNSRPSTPTRRAPAPSAAPVATRSPSVSRTRASNSRNPGPASRPSSPGPRVRPPTQLLALPDFPLDVPPNLRTKLPERPVSAGRTRSGQALTVRANLNSEAVTPTNATRRQSSSPVVTRGRFPENSPKGRLHSNGHEANPPEIQKLVLSETTVRKPTKTTTTTTESTGFGRSISKKSLDMALRHMDIRQGVGGIRGTSLFPQSIRSAVPKGRPARMSDPMVPVVCNGAADMEDDSCNGTICANCNGTASENGGINVKSPERRFLMGRASEPDLYESSRYDAILLKEDSKNMNWLHSVEDISDQSPVFDHRFEPLPEPFGPL